MDTRKTYSIVTPSLLITDDDTAFRETVAGLFRPRGYRVFLAGDGEEALRIVVREELHLVLLDMHMPRLNGLETLQRLKQFKARVPCILLSACWDAALLEQAQQADAFSVLSKPVSGRVITQTVEMALRPSCGLPDATE